MVQLLRVIGRVAIAMYLVWATTTQSRAATPTPSQTVLVTVTTRGIRVSQTELKAGTVRFVLVNQTPRPGLTPLVSPTAGSGTSLEPSSAITPSSSGKGQRPWIDVTLERGTYTLWLSEVPGSTVTVNVTSGVTQ